MLDAASKEDGCERDGNGCGERKMRSCSISRRKQPFVPMDFFHTSQGGRWYDCCWVDASGGKTAVERAEHVV